MNDQKSIWISHLEWVVLFVTLLGGFYSVNTRIDNCNNRIDQVITLMHNESMQFHGRLSILEERVQK
jgi:hypothetical protein